MPGGQWEGNLYHYTDGEIYSGAELNFSMGELFNGI